LNPRKSKQLAAEKPANPYSELPAKAFWRPAVADRSMFDLKDLWTPKFQIERRAPVVTFGSCFAQHIGNALQRRNFNWHVTEAAPPGMSEASRKLFNYNVFSARTANIYTTSLLKQWSSWATGKSAPPDEVWEKNGRFYDPFRPAIEPNGFESVDELLASRNEAIKAFRACIEQARFFVFTLGLTESWFHRKEGYEYPMCPGTIAGNFDPDLHEFRNQNFELVRAALADAIAMMREFNPELRFILTVSPVPLTATKSDQHVLVATMYSKSVLRAVAGQLAQVRRYVDYFPSYEIISSAVFKGTFFEPNLRGVNIYGVELVMEHFFQGLVSKFGNYFSVDGPDPSPDGNKFEEVCEEELLGAFGANK
jgi:hypothetical protein